MIYTHVLNRGGRGVTSPVDRLLGGDPLRAQAARALDCDVPQSNSELPARDRIRHRSKFGSWGDPEISPCGIRLQAPRGERNRPAVEFALDAPAASWRREGNALRSGQRDH